MVHHILIEELPELAMLAVLLACSAFFSGSETALFSLTREDRRRLGLTSSRSNSYILTLLHDPKLLLSTILLGNMVVNIAFYSFSYVITRRLAEVSATAAVVSGTAAVLIVILLGEVTPKGIAVGHPMRFSHLVAPPLYLFFRIVRPVSGVLRRIAQAVTGFLETRVAQLPYVTRDELKMLMGVAEQQGVVDRETLGMMEQVVELANIRVNEVMTPRVDMVTFDLASNREEFCRLVRKTHQDRIPVYKDSVDNIQGVIVSRDVFLRPGSDPSELIQPVHFVPETQTVESLLRQFRETRDPVAIVVDEFGGTSGLLTREHLLEEVVGEIRDEFEPEQTPVRQLDEDTYLLAGDLSTHEWRPLLGVGFDPPGVETVGGFATFLLGKIPKEGDFVEWRGLRFTIEKMQRRRVAMVRVQRIRDESED